MRIRNSNLVNGQLARHRFGNKFTAIDLFCGAGGLSLGLKQAGFQVLAGIEIEEIPVNTFRMNHPDVL